MSNISAGTSTTTSLVQTGDLTGNLVLQSNAVSIATVTSTGVLVSGIVSATGNVTGGNITTVGLITATGNVTGGNITTVGLITATGNVTGGNLSTGGVITATGNVTGGNLSTGGVITGTLKGVKVTLSDLGTLTTGTTTINLATAQVFTATITAANTITVAFSNAPAAGQSQVVLLRLINAGSGTIVWPASTKFTGGTAPTLTASGVDVLGVYYDVTTTTYMVFTVGLNVKVP